VTNPLETILTALGSTSAFVAVILVCGFSLSLVRLNYFQRDVLDQMSAGRERYPIRGSAFVLFIALLLVIGLGILSGALGIGLFDVAGMALLALPIAINEFRAPNRPLRRRAWIFIAYVTAGSILIMLLIGSRISTANWTTQLGLLSNSAVVGIQVIVFARRRIRQSPAPTPRAGAEGYRAACLPSRSFCSSEAAARPAPPLRACGH